MPKQEIFDGTVWQNCCGEGADVSVQNTVGTNIPITGSLTISAGSVNMTLGAELEALSAFAQTGLVARTGVGSYVGRTLTAGTGINITNGDGVSGDPVIGLSTSAISINGAVIGTGTNSITTTLNQEQTITSLKLNTCNVFGTISTNNPRMGLFTSTNCNDGVWFENDRSIDAPYNVLRLYVGLNEVMRISQNLGDHLFKFYSGIDLDGKIIQNVENPSNSQDAATKNYVDSNISTVNTDISTVNTDISTLNNKLQYFNYWDESYPNNFTRSIYVNNQYIPGFRPYGTYGHLTSSGITGTASDSPTYDIKCDGRIRAAEIDAWSSKNIKNILETGKVVHEEAALIIESLPTVKYSYKDAITDGKGEYFGVISEEILDIIPDYVSTNEFKYAPNIMQFGVLKSVDTNTVSIKKLIDISPDIINKKIRIIEGEHAFEGVVLSNKKNVITIRTEKPLEFSKSNIDVFVYGTYEDCPTVSKLHLFEMALCAVQNCLVRIKNLENQNKGKK